MREIVDIVIPARNLWEMTRRCLESLRQATPGDYYRVVLCDDGSEDETPAQAGQVGQALFPGRFIYRRSETCQGFAGACNLGAQGSYAKYLLFLNNDTIALPNWLEPLLKAASRDPALGALSPLQLFPEDRRVQHAGVAFGPELNPVHIFWLFPGEHRFLKHARSFQALSASCFLTPREAFERCEGFFQGYRNGGEDLDLCCRLRRLKLDLRLEPASRILHQASQTPGRFEHVKENSRVLNERCQGCFREDLHAKLAAAGLELRLNPGLQAQARLPREQEAGLDAKFGASAPADELEQALQEYPLWEKGYLLRCNELCAAGDTASAYVYARLAANFFASPYWLSQASELAMQNGRTAEAGQFKRSLDYGARLLANPEALREKAVKLSQLYFELREKRLYAMYQDWIKEHSI